MPEAPPEQELNFVQALKEIAKNDDYVVLGDFTNWLYDHGPDPSSMTRDRLLGEYFIWRAKRTMAETPATYVPLDGQLPLLRPSDE